TCVVAPTPPEELTFHRLLRSEDAPSRMSTSLGVGDEWTQERRRRHAVLRIRLPGLPPGIFVGPQPQGAGERARDLPWMRQREAHGGHRRGDTAVGQFVPG
ncbi:MAG TPA: hypothetical protein VGC99_19125, partial [Candidatus Tectomicrobia bacterium]